MEGRKKIDAKRALEIAKMLPPYARPPLQQPGVSTMGRRNGFQQQETSVRVINSVYESAPAPGPVRIRSRLVNGLQAHQNQLQMPGSITLVINGGGPSTQMPFNIIYNNAACGPSMNPHVIPLYNNGGCGPSMNPNVPPQMICDSGPALTMPQLPCDNTAFNGFTPSSSVPFRFAANKQHNDKRNGPNRRNRFHKREFKGGAVSGSFKDVTVSKEDLDSDLDKYMEAGPPRANRPKLSVITSSSSNDVSMDDSVESYDFDSS